MWEKSFRSSLFSLVYQDLFWRDLGVETYDPKQHLELVLSEVKLKEGESLPSEAKLLESLSAFEEKEGAFETELKKYLNQYDKTYTAVRALLFTFLVERDMILEKKEDPGDIVGKYIRLTQNMVGGENTGLVHAVLSKIVGGKKAEKEAETVEKSE